MYRCVWRSWWPLWVLHTSSGSWGPSVPCVGSGWSLRMGLLHMGHTLRISSHFSRHLDGTQNRLRCSQKCITCSNIIEMHPSFILSVLHSFSFLLWANHWSDEDVNFQGREHGNRRIYDVIMLVYWTSLWPHMSWHFVSFVYKESLMVNSLLVKCVRTRTHS